jgi:hypothetical protein
MRYLDAVAVDAVGLDWTVELEFARSMIQKQRPVEDLERIFSVRRALPGFSSNIFWAKAVTNLARTVSDVLRPDLCAWQQPYTQEIGPSANKPERAEFYAWLLRLRPEQRLIRYGCDKHFNRLPKKPRVFRAKVKKKRPYPVWLTPYMYGGHPMTCRCDRCMKKQG